METVQTRPIPSSASASPRPSVRSSEEELIQWYTHWATGNLSYLLRPHQQTQLYRWIKSLRGAAPIILNCHRRLGKSTLLLLLLIERCLKQPGTIAKLGAPTQKQVDEIVLPLMSWLLAECPEEFRPRQAGRHWYWRNPAWDSERESDLNIIGCDYKHGDGLRGPAADIIALDEVAFMDHLEYLVKDVCSYQFVGRINPQLILASTPPRSMAHDFTKPKGFIEIAQAAGRYAEARASKNPDFTLHDEEMLLSIVGTKESIGWQREAECELVSDESRLIVPEFRAVKAEIVLEKIPRPPAFQPWISMDTGWVDNCAVVFGYVNFFEQFLVIERTMLTRYRTTGEIAHMVRQIEQELYGGLGHRPIRIADCTPQQLDDLARDHKLYFTPVEKYDREAAIAKLRAAIQIKKVRIIGSDNAGPNQPLTYQLEHGIWNERRSDFERSETLGHCDALMALVYLNKMINWHQNPAPPPTYDKSTQFWVDPPKPTNHALLEALGRVREHENHI
jgi:hypothetical protein